MRKLIVFLLIFVTGYVKCFAQQDTMKMMSVEAVINSSLHKFRTKIANQKSIVFCIVETELDRKNILFSKNDFIIENGIDAKIVGNKGHEYLLKFLISHKNGRTFITVVKWSLKKKSAREIIYTDLLSRDYYEVI